MSDQTFQLFFAWVDVETPWGPAVQRTDEDVLDLVIEHDEGQIPTAIVEIKNPRIGFISPTRLYWAWIGFQRDGCTPWALFYGRLVGIPEEIEKNTVKMRFITRPADYIFQKQQVAKSLKLLPNYDPIFFDVAKRDDPDAILEGWSALYHVDRLSRQVTASDVLVGEDGTVQFMPEDVFYDSVQCKVLQSPLVAVNVKAEVQWEQQWRGEFTVPGSPWAYPTLGNDPFVADWPKSGSEIGGGWFAGTAWAGERDPDPFTAARLNMKPTQPIYNISWQNKAKRHHYGDTMSVEMSYQPPFGKATVVSGYTQVGILNPYNLDQYGNPAPLNIPAITELNWFCYKPLALDFLGKQSVACLELTYIADRKRSERLEMTLQADMQPVLIDPLVVEDTEQITMKSGDLSLPMIDYENWSSVGKGGSVALGQFIFPDNPLVPGQTSSQVAVGAGTTGMTEPIFSNVAGATTQDGTVVWASLGDTPPTDGAQDWVRGANVPLGTLLLPKPLSGTPNFDALLVPSHLNFPPTGVPVDRFRIYCNGNGGPGDSMRECTKPGMVGGLGNFAEPAEFTFFTNPSGAFLYIAVQAGVTGQHHTTFNETQGSQTHDGSVIWQNIGPVTLPIGGWPGMTPAATYFPSDRGQQSLQHMLCRARAKLRKRARAVQVSFDTRFEVVAQLSCRMNGIMYDVRLPGGSAAGKVIAYKLEAHGDSGEWIGRVTLGCSVGKNPVGSFPLLKRGEPVPRLTADPGYPSYVVDGYVQKGYQQYYATGSTPGDPSYIPSGESGHIAPGDPGYVAPGTPPTTIVTPSNPSNPIGLPPASPPGAVPGPPPGGAPVVPATPSTIPPPTTEGCPPLNSGWLAGPTDPLGAEVGYTPPLADPNDDGLRFPAAPGDLILANQWHGVPSTLNPLNIESYNLEIQQAVHDAIAQAGAGNLQTEQPPPPPIGASIASNPALLPNQIYDIEIAVQQKIIQSELLGTALWYELVLKPLRNGPFANYYAVQTTNLQVPQTIDLSAASEGRLLSYG